LFERLPGLARLLLLCLLCGGSPFRLREAGPATQSIQPRRRHTIMASGKTDELKGRVKEAAGALTGDAKLKREGRLDQTVGKTKQAANKAIESVKKAVK
jgi:uncharacterized protein YjbJ (UPF0337 family)